MGLEDKLEEYRNLASKLQSIGMRKMRICNRIEGALFTFKDETKIEFTSTQKQKIIQEMEALVTEIETVIIPALKQILGMA